MTDLEDRPALAVRADVVPEEWGPGRWVGAHVVEEVGGVSVHAVVDNDCFVLGVRLEDPWNMYGVCVCVWEREMGKRKEEGKSSRFSLYTYSHGAVVLLMMRVLWVQTQCVHEFFFGYSRSDGHFVGLSILRLD